MKLRLRLLPPCLLGVLLAACGPTLDDVEAPLAQQAFAGDEDDPDSHSQGTQLHAAPVRAVQYDNALVRHDGAHREARLLLKAGGIVAVMPLIVNGSTRSLQRCSPTGSPPTGETRNCGFILDGQGVCTPGTRVNLVGGNSNSTRDRCEGAPVLRVCSGEAPCEHLGPGYLASGNSTFSMNACPAVEFVCPDSGVYTALAGPAAPFTSWTMEVSARKGTYPTTHKMMKGEELTGARLYQGATTSAQPWLDIVDVVNARENPVSEGSGAWDPSGQTYLYQVRYTPSGGTASVPLCSLGANWAVPVKGLFNLQGARTESTSSFTLGCDAGVIAKCYRWGYQPWRDGAQPGPITEAHWSCTRMARADYCGVGTSFTQDGTRIRPWDALTPAIIAPPEPNTSPEDLTFEAGWNTTGPTCLSHLRWQHLTASCVPLNPPIYDANGNIVNDCRDPNTPYGPGKCAEICDTAEEAALFYGSRVFNNSAINTL
ncbi:ADYC domain-containing protein [Myxococcus hansupus]|uniref:ADYC domain-containing protein n=1 Tax=Pseudomyxococcus hansupus TaxID=1297742 RepID=UPI000272AF28|nr:ADYC domain-containing protein [Myxococcus hansupus]